MSEEQYKERHLPDGIILNNRYKIIRFLSAGGFGNTYEAEDIDEGCHVAIKELFISGTCKRDDDSRGVTISVAENRLLFSKQKDKFRKEAARLRQINHPGVVKVSDEFEENGTAYYVMDFVRGKSLEDMRDAGQLDEKKSVQYIKQVLSAIEAVHEKGILHMDIKPSNVMINENNKAIVIDFGASKQLETVDGKSLSLSTGIAYTPGYAPIEQMAGKRENIGIPADIYAIGATLYKLITGVTPPDPSELTTNGLPEVKASPEVQAAIKASVQNNYKARPQSVAEFRAILNGNATPKPKPNPNPKPKPNPGGTEIIDDNPSPRRRWLMPLLIACGVLLVGVITVFLLNPFDPNDPKDLKDSNDLNDTIVTPVTPAAPVAPAVEVVDASVDEGYSVAYAGALNLYNSRKYSDCKRECRKLLRQYTSREQKQQLNQLIEYCDTALAAQQAAQQQPTQQAAPAAPATTPAASSGNYSSSATAAQRAAIDELLGNMVWVAGGTFTMGATSEQGSDAESDESPTHSVTLSGFYLCKYEVTQKLWSAVMGNNPSNWKGDNLPVECVSWNDCQTFINKLNELTNNKYGFRLPTEAEWEYAARGGSRSRGYKYSGSDNLGSVAWYDGNSGNKTHAVGGKSPNELGLYDMSGNVWEWTSSKWCDDYSSPRNSSNRVLRGGSWNCSAGLCRVSFRDNYGPGLRFSGSGLRLAH